MVLQKYPREYSNFEKSFAKKRFFQICFTFVCFKFLYFKAIQGGTFRVIMGMWVGRGCLWGQFMGGTFGSNLRKRLFTKMASPSPPSSFPPNKKPIKSTKKLQITHTKFFMFFFAFLKPKQNRKNFSLVMCSFFDFSH